MDIFVGQRRADISVTLNLAEVVDVRWVSFDAACAVNRGNTKSVRPWLRIYMAEQRAAIEAPGERRAGQMLIE